jgi:hypothetical protein
MAQLQRTRTGEIHMRVEDYLDDKIQNAADLENVDDLLSRVQQQQDLLRKQVNGVTIYSLTPKLTIP